MQLRRTRREKNPPPNAEPPSTMNEAEYQRVINELQAVLDDTRVTMERFEATGMDEQMPADYEKLLAILDHAVKRQREHAHKSIPVEFVLK